MAQSYRVGIIGSTGRGDYGHGIDVAWKEIPQAKIVALADDDESRGRAAAVGGPGAKSRVLRLPGQMLDKERFRRSCRSANGGLIGTTRWS